MFITQRQQTANVRKVLARAGFIYNGSRYVYTRNPVEIQNYLASEDLGVPRQTRRRKSEMGLFASIVMMFALTHIMGNMQMVLR